MNDNTRLRMLKAGIAGAETLAEAKEVIIALGLGAAANVPYIDTGGMGFDLGKVTCASTNGECGK